MDPRAKLIGALLVLLAFASILVWGFYERSGRMQAEGRLELSNERIREQNRGITALGNATTAAAAEAAVLRRQRSASNAPLVAQIARLEEALKRPAPAGKDCRAALSEAREELKNGAQ